jgi:hypothetical protein
VNPLSRHDAGRANEFAASAMSATTLQSALQSVDTAATSRRDRSAKSSVQALRDIVLLATALDEAARNR